MVYHSTALHPNATLKLHFPPVIQRSLYFLSTRFKLFATFHIQYHKNNTLIYSRQLDESSATFSKWNQTDGQTDFDLWQYLSL